MKRRQFLKYSTASLGSGFLTLQGMDLFAQQAPFADYKCLVNIFLFGGNDSFNLVAPTSNAEYNIYAASRQNLAIPQSSLLPIFPDNPDGASYGLHPSATALRDLFDQGDAAIVANMGPMVQPVTKDSFLNGSAVVPPQLFSHNDQQNQWQTLKGKSNSLSGWAGRIADLLTTSTHDQGLALNTSTIGTNFFQAGIETIPYTISPQGANTYGAFDQDAEFGEIRKMAFEQYLGQGFDNIHARAISAVHQRALLTASQVNTALDLVPDLNTQFPDSELGNQLKMVARLIAVKDEFQMSRQIFFTGAEGFDTHDDQLQVQPELFTNLSDCLAAFQNAMLEIGQADSVVTFTQSDFGRTLTSNGDGTDHGWGGHQIVVGRPVLGKNIYGTMPILEIGGPDDITAGRIVPTLAVDQYAATFARWFGVDEANLNAVAPNLTNFSTSNIGFL